MCPRQKENVILMEQSKRILRLPEVLKMTGLSRTSIWRQIDAGTFPKSVKLGPRAVGWRASDIEEWLRNRPSTG